MLSAGTVPSGIELGGFKCFYQLMCEHRVWLRTIDGSRSVMCGVNDFASPHIHHDSSVQYLTCPSDGTCITLDSIVLCFASSRFTALGRPSTKEAFLDAGIPAPRLQ